MQDLCSECKNLFNLTKRRPILLDECGCSLCLECVNFLLKSNPKREICCPEDKLVSTMPEMLKENKPIVRKLQLMDQLTVLCDDHEGQIASQYCTTCQIPTCSHCKLDAHKEHSHINLKQSQFQIYSDNVFRLLDEYSVKNIKSMLSLQASNETELKSSQFQTMISKIQRILGNVVSSEELKQIDIVSYLEDPQNIPYNDSRSPDQNTKEEHKTQNSQKFEDIQLLIKESHSQLREEFKTTMEAFENNFSYVKSQTNSNIQPNDKTFQDNCAKLIEEFKRDMQLNLSDKFKAIDDINLKMKNYDQRATKFEQQIEILIQIVDNAKSTIIEKRLIGLEGKVGAIDDNQNLSANLEEEKSENDQNQIQSQIEVPSVEDCKKLTVDEKKQLFRDLVDQEINKTQYSLLKQQLSYTFGKKYKLLYSGSRDGFKALRFHQLCDIKGPTVTFILSEYGLVFGGYTSVSWTTSDYATFNDNEAFIQERGCKTQNKLFEYIRRI
eukprot:403354475